MEENVTVAPSAAPSTETVEATSIPMLYDEPENTVEVSAGETQAAAAEPVKTEAPPAEPAYMAEMKRLAETMGIASKRYESEIAALKQQIMGMQQAPKEQPKVDFRNIAEMTPDEIHTHWETDPRGFLGNLVRQVMHETESKIGKFDKDGFKKELKNETKAEQVKRQMAGTVQKYVQENPDFIKSLPQIRKFMVENPGHNEISAHMTMNRAAIEKAAVEKAKQELMKQGKEQVVTPIKSGGTTPANVSPSFQNALKNQKQYGGDSTSWIRDTLRSFRKSTA